MPVLYDKNVSGHYQDIYDWMSQLTNWLHPQLTPPPKK